MVKSDEARVYQQYVKDIAKDAYLAAPMDGPVAVIIDVWAYKRRNLDNCVKVLLDALNGVAFVDDGQVQTLWVNRLARAAKEKPHVEVTITSSQAMLETLLNLAQMTGMLMKKESPTNANG